MKKIFIYICLLLTGVIVLGSLQLDDIKSKEKQESINECVFCELSDIEHENMAYIICTNDSTVLDISKTPDFMAKNKCGDIEELSLIKKHSCENGTIVIKKKYDGKSIALDISYNKSRYDNIKVCSNCKEKFSWEKGYIFWNNGQIQDLIQNAGLMNGIDFLDIKLHKKNLFDPFDEICTKSNQLKIIY